MSITNEIELNFVGFLYSLYSRSTVMNDGLKDKFIFSYDMRTMSETKPIQ